uniref:Transmembrane protein n=1 Tax=Caenorhabditis tropicalis TaxID=1561998 RepID=A0A1I7SZW4_9PELO
MGLVNWALTFDAIFAAVSGVALYLFPDKFGDFCFQKETDGVHWHLIRCIGGQIFASCLVSVKFRNSSHTSQSVLHFIRLIPSILILMLVFQIQSVTPTLVEPNVMNFIVYEFVTKKLPDTQVLQISYGLNNRSSCYTFVRRWVENWLKHFLAIPNSSEIILGTKLAAGNRFGNFLYQLDALASICIGTCWMTFPKWLLHRQVLVNLDESHEFLGRVMGANFIASYIVATHVLHWESQQDRNVAVDGRVICCISILVAQFWSQKYPSWSGNHWVGIGLFSTWTVISVIYRICLTISRKGKKE